LIVEIEAPTANAAGAFSCCNARSKDEQELMNLEIETSELYPPWSLHISGCNDFAQRWVIV